MVRLKPLYERALVMFSCYILLQIATKKGTSQSLCTVFFFLSYCNFSNLKVPVELNFNDCSCDYHNETTLFMHGQGPTGSKDHWPSCTPCFNSFCHALANTLLASCNLTILPK